MLVQYLPLDPSPFRNMTVILDFVVSTISKPVIILRNSSLFSARCHSSVEQKARSI